MVSILVTIDERGILFREKRDLAGRGMRAVAMDAATGGLLGSPSVSEPDHAVPSPVPAGEA
jgi:hypothetical protein